MTSEHSDKPATITKLDHQIHFTIDGRAFTVTDPHQTAGGLLRLAGLDPNGYHLGELHGTDPKPKVFGSNEDRIDVRDGERFVSIRERAAVA